MSKWDKLLARLLSMPNDMRFEELQKILEAYGYEMHLPVSGSSHCTFRKEGCSPITIPRQKPVKIVYVKMVKALVEGDSKDEKH